MAIIIPKKKMDTATNQTLKGAAAKLESLVKAQSDYDFEGYQWMKRTIKQLAKELSINEKTVRRILSQHKYVFRYLIRNTKQDGRHALIRVGSGHCESDVVEYLRKNWVHGLVFFNAALVKHLQFKLENLDDIQFDSKEQRNAYAKRLSGHIDRAMAGAANLDKVKAAEKISLEVTPTQMGLLRGVVQKFDEHAQSVLQSLLTFDGWELFMGQLKSEGATSNFYHWPNLSIILKHPDIALDTHLTLLQSKGKISMPDANDLMNKILKTQKKGSE